MVHSLAFSALLEEIGLNRNSKSASASFLFDWAQKFRQNPSLSADANPSMLLIQPMNASALWQNTHDIIPQCGSGMNAYLSDSNIWKPAGWLVNSQLTSELPGGRGYGKLILQVSQY